ncbi:wiskott-Aldrich syndrome protein family member 2-like [Setaria italica]|uniref:wiskott-Aldrich syndrome protein family member 2-like n=1 Tax=Setaria italica TaxID=4555 RepID=UPI000648B1E3|nr:wiskott-Aldrich syndrome protein family member 2-like [Setaria italica]
MSSADSSMSCNTTTPTPNPVPPPGLPPAANSGASVPPPGTSGSFGGAPQAPPAGDVPGNGSGGFIVYPPQPLAIHPYATVSIKSHVPVALMMKSNAYSRCASFLKSMYSKFSLKSHIDGTVAPYP